MSDLSNKIKLDVHADPNDLRDRIYQPTLRPLPPAMRPHGFYSETCAEEGGLCYLVRHQGSRGTCTGMALAHLIDMNLFESAASRSQPVQPDIVSARMLYEMARRQDGKKSGDGVSSLRSAIKGFYHFGVCSEDSWPYEPWKDEDELDRDRAMAARGVTLGAYYRVRPYLNDYHAALSDAKALLVSADVHSGWFDSTLDGTKAGVRAEDKVIRSARDSRGGHAFVIVGYNDQGFLVLNSWGSGWGGYEGCPGIALWPYEDWAARVMDAWVLRLGVSAPKAFNQSIGHQGIFLDMKSIKSGSSACHELLGHFAHLDDGKHVEHGSYFSSRRSVQMTVDRLQVSKRPVVLMIPGSLLGMKQAFDFEVRRRPVIEAANVKPKLYPYTLFWCNDFVESSTDVLTRLFEEAVRQAGPRGPALESAIEKATHGIGRAFWRDVKRAARIATRRDSNDRLGDAAHVLDTLFAIDGVDVHVVIEGAGAVLFGDYLTQSGAHLSDPPVWMQGVFDNIASLTLITPTIEHDDFADAYGQLIRKLGERGGNNAFLWTPSEALEDKLRVGPYSKSILDLVLYGFEGAEKDRTFVGMSTDRTGMRDKLKADANLASLGLRTIAQPDADRQIYEQDDLTLDPTFQKKILKDITRIQKTLNRERKR